MSQSQGPVALLHVALQFWISRGYTSLNVTEPRKSGSSLWSHSAWDRLSSFMMRCQPSRVILQSRALQLPRARHGQTVIHDAETTFNSWMVISLTFWLFRHWRHDPTLYIKDLPLALHMESPKPLEVGAQECPRFRYIYKRTDTTSDWYMWILVWSLRWLHLPSLCSAIVPDSTHSYDAAGNTATVLTMFRRQPPNSLLQLISHCSSEFSATNITCFSRCCPIRQSAVTNYARAITTDN